MAQVTLITVFKISYGLDFGQVDAKCAVHAPRSREIGWFHFIYSISLEKYVPCIDRSARLAPKKSGPKIQTSPAA